MKKLIALLITPILLTSCSLGNPFKETTYKEAKDSHTTVLTTEISNGTETEVPPEGSSLSLVEYPSEVGNLDAYISTNPNDGQKHPLVIWVGGGWTNSIDSNYWLYNPWENDQSGAILRQKGILMMYPSTRGGNQNPGFQESLYGEINDIHSALDYASTLDYVDPDRIYLVGHSTGGTKALLAGAYDQGFRAIFSFGPVDDIMNHNQSQFTFDPKDKVEAELRSPINWINDIKTPTFIIEGENGNSANLKALERKDNNDYTEYYIMQEADHFTDLAPATKLIADKILADTGEECNITITEDELDTAFNGEPVTVFPDLATKSIENSNLKIDVPAYYKQENKNDQVIFYDRINYEDDAYESFWSDTQVYINVTPITDPSAYTDTFYREYLETLDLQEIKLEEINGTNIYSGYTYDDNDYYYYVTAFNDTKYEYSVIFFCYNDDLINSKALVNKMYQSINVK